MLAVLITVHNRLALTLRCLQCLARACEDLEIRVDIYLVDDGSTDGTRECINEKYPHVQFIEGTGDLYWNRGMHLAWKTATEAMDYSYYLWLNNDTFMREDCLRALIDYSSSLKDEAILCAQTESESTGLRTYGGVIKGGLPLSYKDGLAECDIINGNCVLIPSSVYMKVGLLDPTFPHALGDHDYSLRAKELGILSYTTEATLAYCEVNPTPPRWCQPEHAFIERLKNLYSPLACSQPIAYFIYENRHYGLLTALYHFVSIHLRVLLPKLWKR